MFNIEEFDIKLDTEYLGRNFIYCDEVDSTNSVLISSKEFSHSGTVLLAEFQSKGRGRKDRSWTSTSGQNLTFSILLRNEIKSFKLSKINFGASLAVAQSIENLFQLDIELKWPNDVLVNHKKIAGILIESVSKGNKISKLVVGIGVNVNQANFPGKFDIQPTSVRREFRSTVSREKLLSELLNNYEAILDAVENESDKILNDWRSRCKMIGEKVKIIEEEKIKSGVFEDIDEEGLLILKNGENREKIHYGDVSLR